MTTEKPVGDGRSRSEKASRERGILEGQQEHAGREHCVRGARGGRHVAQETAPSLEGKAQNIGRWEPARDCTRLVTPSGPLESQKEKPPLNPRKAGGS